MKKITLLVSVFAMIVFSGCENNKRNTGNNNTNSNSNIYKVDYILSQLKENRTLKFNETDPKLLFSIAMRTDSTINIMYKPSSMKTLFEMDVKKDSFTSQSFLSAKDGILDIMELHDPNYKVLGGDYNIGTPFLKLKISSLEALGKLCTSDYVNTIIVNSNEFLRKHGQ